MTDSTNPHPASTPDEPTVVLDQGEPAAEKPARSRKRPLLIGAAVAAAVVLVGGGVAIGAAIADGDDDDDDRTPVAQTAPGTAQDSSRGEEDRDDDDRADDDRADDSADDQDDVSAAPSGGPSSSAVDPATFGAASADELSDVIATAAAEATGDATSIDFKRDGHWDIEFTAADGSETDVRVDADGTASVFSTDTETDDSAPAGVLDTATIDALVTAAFAEHEGRIIEIDVDNDTASPYDLTVLRADGVTVELDFGPDFAVLATDLDD